MNRSILVTIFSLIFVFQATLLADDEKKESEKGGKQVHVIKMEDLNDAKERKKLLAFLKDKNILAMKFTEKDEIIFEVVTVKDPKKRMMQPLLLVEKALLKAPVIGQWKGKIRLGGAYFKGNRETERVAVDVEVAKNFSEIHRLSFKFKYDHLRDRDLGERYRSVSAISRYDHKFDGKNSLFLLGSVGTDDQKNLELKSEVTLGYRYALTKSLSFELGAGYRYESRDEILESENADEFIATYGIHYKRLITNRFIFEACSKLNHPISDEYEEEYRLRSELGFSVPLTTRFKFECKYFNEYFADPIGDAEPRDQGVLASILFEF